MKDRDITTHLIRDAKRRRPTLELEEKENKYVWLIFGVLFIGWIIGRTIIN